jgi:ribosomal-protein-alanine N-acetyltransferase
MSAIAETDRLIIREFLPEEEDLFVDMHQDEDVARYLPPRTADEYRKVFRESQEANSAPTGLSRWGIFNKTNGSFIGSCLMRDAKDAPGKIEMGYSLCKGHWGKGYATEMAKALLDYGFTKMKFPLICAVTHPDNMPSQNVLLKAGMQRNGEVFWHGSTLSYFFIETKN